MNLETERHYIETDRGGKMQHQFGNFKTLETDRKILETDYETLGTERWGKFLSGNYKALKTERKGEIAILVWKV